METKTALVTGGSRGIGRGIVLALAASGWSVTFSYQSDAAAAEETVRLASESAPTPRSVRADIRSKDDRDYLVKIALEPTGKIDLLVNNAGMAPRARCDLLELSEESFDEVTHTNLKGPFFLTQQVSRLMISQASEETHLPPCIINIGSISAYTSSTNRGEYCISKAGVAMMTALFADRLAADGVLVYEIRPGIIDTDMTSAAKEKYDRLIAQGLLPIRRWGRPEDIARAVIAIAEGYLPYSTGEVINVDGGFHLRRL